MTRGAVAQLDRDAPAAQLSGEERQDGPPARQQRSHVFGFDLMRASSLLMVLLAHAGVMFTGWTGGHLPHVLAVSGTFAVETFFVLSGYLVGRILLRTVAETPRADMLGRFLLRRWMRTVPLYWIAIAALAVLLPPAPGLLWRDIVRYASFTQNLAPPQLDWFFPVAWTLAAEEWFYAGFGVLLYGAASVLGGRRGMLVVLALFLLGPILARLFLFIDPSEYRIVPFWLDSIGWGVFAAIVAAWRPALFRRGAALPPIAFALTALFWADETWRFLPAGPHRVFGFGAIAFAIALLLPAARAMQPPRWRPLELCVRWLSERAYGIYLVHVAVLQLVDPHRATWGVAPSIAVSVVLILLVPEFTWRCIEKPIIDRRPRERGSIWGSPRS